MVELSIIIVSWNAKAYLEECLGSLSVPTAKLSKEIFVIDNDSHDGSPEMVEEKFPQVKLIRNGANLGFSKANNIGIRESTGQYLCLINSDVRVLPGCLDGMAEFMDRNPQVGIAGPRMLNRDLSMQVSCRNSPSLWNNFCAASGLATFFPGVAFLSSEQMFYFAHDRTAPVDVIAGCYWIVRRKAMEDFGLLDEAFFFYGEDLDWCKRCRSAGWDVVFHPGGESVHYQGGSSSNDPLRFSVAQQRAVLLYWTKHHSTWACVMLRLILILGNTLRLIREGMVYAFNSSDRARRVVRLRGYCSCLRALIWL